MTHRVLLKAPQFLPWPPVAIAPKPQHLPAPLAALGHSSNSFNLRGPEVETEAVLVSLPPPG